MSKFSILCVVLIAAVMIPSLVASGVQAQGPLITSVLQVRAVPGSVGLVYMTINGKGFGTGPLTEVTNTGSGVDTERVGSTPSLAICDINQDWNAGGAYPIAYSLNVGHGCTVSGYNSIGVYLNAWTNTQIVLGGFGNNAGGCAPYSYPIHTGDTLVFVVFGPNNSGYATYVTSYIGPTVTCEI